MSSAVQRHFAIAIKHLRQHGFCYSAASFLREIHFDLKNGVHTVALASPLSIPHAVSYQGADPQVIRDLLAALPQSARESHFLDYGCGKGRALLVAIQHGFRQLTGIEIDPNLMATCKSNLSKVAGNSSDVRVDFFEGDASLFHPPSGKVTAFFYNPFSGPPLREVAHRLKANANLPGSEVWILYINPLHLSVFTALGFKTVHTLKHRKTTLAIIAHWRSEA